MAEDRRRQAPENGFVKGEIREDPLEVSVSSDSGLELERLRLRQRWELASVFNFINVFESLIGRDVKISAEEIETGLITPNSSLAKLHISLLKGIPPVSKTLNGSDAWVTVLCKKLDMWWPWVAEGELPLSVSKGEEIPKYRELNPTTRLLMLKALCEVRAGQDDVVSYINDTLKNGAQISNFRKYWIAGDGNGTSYWYDGDATIGHRLYKEVKKFTAKTKVKGNGILTLPSINLQWETLATNLEEFRKVADEFSSSKDTVEVDVCKTIETDAIPALEKLHKKKERQLKQKQRQELLLNDHQNTYFSGVTRSCRNRRPARYTFDDYDRAIDEAIQLTKKMKPSEKQRQEGKHSARLKKNDIASNGVSEACKKRKNASTESDTESDKSGNDDENGISDGHHDVKHDEDEGDGKNGSDSDGKQNNCDDEESSDGDSDGNQEDTEDEENSDGDYDDKNDDGNDENDFESDSGDSAEEDENETLQSNKRRGHFAHRPAGSRSSKRLVVEAKSPSMKSRLRRRPTRNAAVDESDTVPDSEDTESSENTVTDKFEEENMSSDDEDSEEDQNLSIEEDHEEEEEEEGDPEECSEEEDPEENSED